MCAQNWHKQFSVRNSKYIIIRDLCISEYKLKIVAFVSMIMARTHQVWIQYTYSAITVHRLNILFCKIKWKLWTSTRYHLCSVTKSIRFWCNRSLVVEIKPIWSSKTVTSFWIVHFIFVWGKCWFDDWCPWARCQLVLNKWAFWQRFKEETHRVLVFTFPFIIRLFVSERKSKCSDLCHIFLR